MDRDGCIAMSWTEITSLVELARAGDRAAYGELVERFRTTVYGIALARLRNPAEAEELTQEVFLHGMKKLPQLREGSVRGPLESMISDEQKAELYEGLSRLKPLDRATLQAFYLRGRSLVQMAQEFETPIGTIKRRLHVARLRLKRVLEGAATEGGGKVKKPKKPRAERELACV